jgi:hypothetical protein
LEVSATAFSYAGDASSVSAQDLIQVVREPVATAGNAGRERGPSHTPPALAVIREKPEWMVQRGAAGGWLLSPNVLLAG